MLGGSGVRLSHKDADLAPVLMFTNSKSIREFNFYLGPIPLLGNTFLLFKNPHGSFNSFLWIGIDILGIFVPYFINLPLGFQLLSIFKNFTIRKNGNPRITKKKNEVLFIKK